MVYSNDQRVLGIASFCYNELKLSGAVNIEVVELEDAWGWCYSDGSIEVSDAEMLEEDFYKTICHEMTHRAQLEQGRKLCENEAYSMENKLYVKWSELH